MNKIETGWLFESRTYTGWEIKHRCGDNIKVKF